MYLHFMLTSIYQSFVAMYMLLISMVDLMSVQLFGYLDTSVPSMVRHCHFWFFTFVALQLLVY